MRIHIEPFGPNHDRTAFSCGNDYIDTQLQRSVLPLHEMNLTRAFVAVQPGQNKVVGFYAMNNHMIETWEAPANWQGWIKDHGVAGIPAVYISLFATDEPFQGMGVGKSMMGDALRRIRLASEMATGIYAVVLDAADQKAYDFYEKIGFENFGSNHGMRMFYPVAAIPKSKPISQSPTAQPAKVQAEIEQPHSSAAAP